MSQTRGVVWDMDGVIVDSEVAHNASWVAMAQEFGVPYDPERDFKDNFGRHNTAIMERLWNVTDPDQVSRMVESKERNFRLNAHKLQPLPGVLVLMEALKQAGWKQAVGSSAPSENIRILIEVTGIAPYIEAMATGDDVTIGKPDPQVFMLAFAGIGVEPQDGVVIEDAPVGIEAGLRAGAATLGVTTTQPEEALKRAGATRIVATLADINVNDLESLVTHHTAPAIGNANPG